METTSRLTNQPFLILYPVIFQKEKEKKLKSNHIPVDHICSGYPICGVKPSISKSWAAFLGNQGNIVALRRVSLIT